MDSIPSSAGREDHVSMGLPVKAGRGPRAAHELVRSRVPTMEKDREAGQGRESALREAMRS